MYANMRRLEWIRWQQMIKRQKLIVVGLCVAIVWVGVLAIGEYQRSDKFILTMLDIGQGDSFLLETPMGARFVVDGGPDPQRFRGALTQNMVFYHRGIHTMIATHGDEDHIGGLSGILGAFRVGAFKTIESVFDDPSDRRLRDHARAQGVASGFLYRGDVVYQEPDLRIRVLWPPKDLTILGRLAKDSNAQSIALRIDYKKASVLMMADIPKEVEDMLLHRFDPKDLQAQVLKLGHHGSITSSSEAFLDTVHPTIGLVSAGRFNRYGHPAPLVIDRLNGRSIHIARTDTQGAIALVSDGQSWSIHPMRTIWMIKRWFGLML